MPRKTTEVTISPAVLKWARETAGYSHENVAWRLNVTQENVETWETASPARLTLRQLEELARFYRRPTAALLLREAPTEPPLPQDFRRPLHRNVPFSPELRFAVRRAYRLQRLIREMMEALGQPYASDIPRANSQEDSETVARVLRESFGISIRQQLGWKTSGEAFRQWRDALESRRIPVFQADFPRRESQGFSVSDAHPYAIVVTSQDPFTARCFTLFHEFAHLLLREGGICLTEEAPSSDGDSLAKTEYWCHRFAEAFLVDADTLRDRRETGIILRRESGYEQALRRLASSFEVSQHVVLFRLWHLGLMSEARFWMEYGRVRQEAAAEAAQRQAKKKESKGGPSPAAHVVQERGRFFTRLVLEALEREMLSYAEAIGYLGVRLKHLDELRQTAYG